MEIRSTRFKLNSDDVVSKVVDGEAIIINLSNGVYYSTDKVGAEIWDLVVREASVDEIVHHLATRYNVERSSLESDVDRIVAQLIEEKLVVPGASDANPGEIGTVVEPGSTGHAGERQAYERPALEVYRDMGDLLALDPPQPGLERTAWKDDSNGRMSEDDGQATR